MILTDASKCKSPSVNQAAANSRAALDAGRPQFFSFPRRE